MEERNDASPYFFVSYSRDSAARDDPYLNRFVKDLREQVSKRVGGNPKEVGFRDVENIERGKNWAAVISRNVRRSHCLICMYSIHFFDEARKHEYCGKEVALFLKRIKEVTYSQGQYRGRFRNIFPILWSAKGDLDFKKLPPYAVTLINYTGEDDDAEYVKRGLDWILRKTKRRKAYNDIVWKLSEQIRDSAIPPLPPLEEDIDIEDMHNAFWEPPDGPAPQVSEPAAEPVEKAAAALPSGPMQLLALEIRILSNAPVWTPYKSQQNEKSPSFAALIGDVVFSPESKFDYKIQPVDPTAERFAVEVSKALAIATGKQIIPILFVHPECLDTEISRAALKEIVGNEWRGGLIVLADEADARARFLLKEYWPELEAARNKQEPAVMRIATGSGADFQTAFASVAQAVLALIQKKGEAKRPHPNREGPDAPPRFTNALTPRGPADGR
jgi:hypothetical protein